MKKHILSILGLLALLGCAPSAPPLTLEEIKSANYGSPLPKNYKQLIRQAVGSSLVDPTSPLYEFAPPHKGYTQENSLFETPQAFGWMVCGTINAKNTMGGYTGAQPFFTLFHNGKIVVKMMGEGDFEELNNLIANICTYNVD